MAIQVSVLNQASKPGLPGLRLAMTEPSHFHWRGVYIAGVVQNVNKTKLTQ